MSTKAKNKNKKPKKDAAKKAKADADKAAEADSSATQPPAAPTAVERPAFAEPWQWIPEWFEQWPPVIGRRVPELMTQIGLTEAIKVEEERDGDSLVIRAEIPGVDPENDIDVSVTAGKLTISAHREQREETKTDKSFHSEFRYGSFHRSLPVPQGTQPEDVKASYVDGILEVRLPVDDTATADRRKVEITRS